MHRGYIKLWRSSVDNPMYFSEPFTRWQAWNDLLLMANHKPRDVRIRGILIHLSCGELLGGDDFLAQRWKWSRGKVRRFMSELSEKTVHQIVQRKSNVITVISIVNWDAYQSDSTAYSTASSTTDGHQTVQQTDTPKNVENVEKEKNGVCSEAPELPSKPDEDKNRTEFANEGSMLSAAQREQAKNPPRQRVNDNEKVLLSFPCVGPVKEWHLVDSKLAEWVEAYAGSVSIMDECKKARQWLLNNPTRRKTANGMPRFLNSWITRAVDRNKGPSGSGPMEVA
jgi:hypothetical protein